MSVYVFVFVCVGVCVCVCVCVRVCVCVCVCFTQQLQEVSHRVRLTSCFQRGTSNRARNEQAFVAGREVKQLFDSTRYEGQEQYRALLLKVNVEGGN